MSLGWKVGFGAPAAMEKLGIDRPLVAPITHATLLEDGATVDVSAWTNPMIELEIAVHAGAGIGVALELVDLHTPPADPQEILAGGIYHRHTVLGPVLGEATPTGGALSRDGELVAETDDPAALTGGHEAMVRVVEETIGRKLEPGEVVITGSIVPPTPIAAGQRWQGEVQGLGALAVTLSSG
jgi:2-keto-4-pentenoate hydratase